MWVCKNNKLHLHGQWTIPAVGHNFSELIDEVSCISFEVVDGASIVFWDSILLSFLHFLKNKKEFSVQNFPSEFIRLAEFYDISL